MHFSVLVYYSRHPQDYRCFTQSTGQISSRELPQTLAPWLRGRITSYQTEICGGANLLEGNVDKHGLGLRVVDFETAGGVVW